MNFDFSPEQEMLRTSVRRLVAEFYGAGQHRVITASQEGFSRDCWRALADMGILAMSFGEDAGGLDDAAIETMIIMEEFGRELVLEPYIPTIILGGGLVRYGGSKEQKVDLIPAIVSGDLLLAFAFEERASRFNPAYVETRATKSGGVYLLNGVKTTVLRGGAADRLFVSARTAGAPTDQAGISVFMIDPTAKGVSIESYKTVDGQTAATVRLENVEASEQDAFGELGGAFPLMQKVLDEAVAALCADAHGAMSVLHETTLEFCKTRVAFGKPIGKFQVLQHRLVDMLLAQEQAASLAILATLSLSEPAPKRAKAVSAAKVKIGRDSRFVGQNAVQLHGGAGTTDELSVGFYFKRLLAFESAFGDAGHHTRRFSEAGCEVL